MAKLSVIIPCYNNGTYLKEMMECCLRQTFSDWELVIVDDQSTDGSTQQIVKEYSEKDSRIKFYIRERQPKGSVVCRNIGFDHSTGEYIIHFDADDLISDTCFEKRVKFMEENPDLDYASFPAKSFINGKPLPEYDGTASFGMSKGDKDLLYYFLSSNYPFSVWCNIYKRDSIRNLPWDERVLIYTDFSFIIPCIMAGLKHKFCEMKEYDYFYRTFEHGKNMCSDFISKEKCESTIYLFNKTLSSISALENSDSYYTAFRRFIVLHFERLIKGRMFPEAERYCGMLSGHYPTDFTEELSRIATSCKNIKSDKLLRIRLHYLLYKHYRIGLYKAYLIHEVVKLILLR